MALRVVGWKSKRTADPDERVLVTLIQQDGSGKLVTEQGLWDASKITKDDMVMLEKMHESDKDTVFPTQLLARFTQMRKRCEVPNEAAKNKLIKEHFTIYISNKNDVFIDETSEEEEEEEEESEEDSASGSEDEEDQ